MSLTKKIKITDVGGDVRNVGDKKNTLFGKKDWS